MPQVGYPRGVVTVRRWLSRPRARGLIWPCPGSPPARPPPPLPPKSRRWRRGSVPTCRRLLTHPAAAAYREQAVVLPHAQVQQVGQAVLDHFALLAGVRPATTGPAVRQVAVLDDDGLAGPLWALGQGCASSPARPAGLRAVRGGRPTAPRSTVICSRPAQQRPRPWNRRRVSCGSRVEGGGRCCGGDWGCHDRSQAGKSGILPAEAASQANQASAQISSPVPRNNVGASAAAIAPRGRRLALTAPYLVANTCQP